MTRASSHSSFAAFETNKIRRRKKKNKNNNMLRAELVLRT